MGIKTYKHRIYANKTTTDKLYGVLDLCRELYNAGLQERREAYETRVKQHPNYYDETTRKRLTREHAINVYQQKRDLVEIKEVIRPEYQEVASHVLQDVLFRLEKAYQRQDFLHQESRKLVNRYQVIVFEDVQIMNLLKRPKPKQEGDGRYLPNGAAAKAGLNKSIADAGWSQFVQYCAYKAAWAGRTLVQVDPRYTSQVCSGCGAAVKKTLEEREHRCACGCELDRGTFTNKYL